MKRSALIRKTPMRSARPTGVLAQASFTRLRAKKCAICREPFEPARPGMRVCGESCAAALGKAITAKAERKADRAQREKLKTRQQWLKEAQTAFNAFIRERDKDMPCICCGRATTAVDGLGAHGWDCGHYRSVGSAPHMRFVENNAHRQLVACNRYGAGRAVDYRIGLIARIGLEAVEVIESDDQAKKYSIEELQAIKASYKAKLKQLQGK